MRHQFRSRFGPARPRRVLALRLNLTDEERAELDALADELTEGDEAAIERGKLGPVLLAQGRLRQGGPGRQEQGGGEEGA